MFKYVLSAFICLAFAMPAAAQCGCEAPCRTPKTLGFVPVKRCLPQISMKCTTDACGCSRRRLSVERVEVTGARLGLVDRKPCGGMLKGLFSCNKGCGCEKPEPASEPCGCEPMPEPCGCDHGDMQIDAAPIYADPVSAPAADCGCNG